METKKGILDKVIANKEEAAKRKNIALCPKCGNEMLDNTFMRGSKLAGRLDCQKCGLKMII